ncbi:MAG: nucleotide exchange factor GrpE [Desulfosalsimonas sp.]
MMQEEENEKQEDGEPEDELEINLDFDEQDNPDETLSDAVNDLRAKMRTLAEEFEAKLKYDDHKNRIIDGLHQELQQYREGLIKKYFHSMVTDAIKIIDDIRKFKTHYEEQPPTKETLPSLLEFLEDIAEDIEDLFSWQGVRPFTCDTEIYDNTRQRVIKKLETDNPQMDKKVAESLRPGYEWEGKMLRPEMVAVYVYKEKTKEQGGGIDG